MADPACREHARLQYMALVAAISLKRGQRPPLTEKERVTAVASALAAIRACPDSPDVQARR